MSRFAVGDRVRVTRAYPPGHVRTPFYVRGIEGTVVVRAGSFRNPERLAYGMTGEPRLTLYRVRFRQTEVWPDYTGPQTDTLDVEIFEHWLEPVQGPHS